MRDSAVDNVMVSTGSQQVLMGLFEAAPFDNYLSTRQREQQGNGNGNGNGRRQVELPPVRAMVVEEKYTGIVEEVTGDLVYVSLRHTGTGDEEYTSIDRSQLGERAAASAVPGAAFTWSIGHHDEAGHRIGVSFIEFAVPYEPTPEERQAAREEGDEAAARLLAGETRRTSFG